MLTTWLLLAAALALVAACGVFVAAEFAFVTVDRGAVDRAAEAGDRRARGVQRALRTLSTQLSGAQVGITLTNLAIGFLAEPAIAELVDGPLKAAGLSPGAVPGVAVTIGLLVATVLTMVFGELVPKNLAIANPFAVACATQAAQRGFTKVMAFPIRLLNGSANAIVRRLGIEPQEELRSARTSDELASLIHRSAAEGTLEAGTARLLERSVAFGDRDVADIMTPRVRMNSVAAAAPVVAVVELARATGHSRFPVSGEDTDDIIGTVHLKHAVAVPVDERGSRTVAEVMTDPAVVPESLTLDPLLDRLRSEGFQMAVVVDEYGGTAGVVTLEDVVEEIVGGIADEHDRLGARAHRRRDGSWMLSGLLRPDEVTDLTGVPLPEGDDYETVAGMVLALLGRMPETGDTVEVPLPPGFGASASKESDDGSGDTATVHQAVLTVHRLDGMRIDRLTLCVHAAPDGSGEEAADSTGAGSDR
jgi:CBS domain containing-hemolysin-like protein